MLRGIFSILTVLLAAFCPCSFQADIADKYFPQSFRFGASTAAYQIEGAWNEDGKGENMWDHWLHENAGHTDDGLNGDVACDSYHKWQEDVQHLKELGVQTYRFSLSWSRILPTGYPDTINQLGVDYYLTLIKTLKENGIEPIVTIYHWDLPEVFNEQGGWLVPEVSDHYESYARVCFQLFGEQVKYWVTVNEPKSTCMWGYGTGIQAPGLTLIGDGVYTCAHNILLAHAKAWHVYDTEFRSQQGGKVGIVLDHTWSEPASNSQQDAEAVERENEFGLGWYANPVYLGNYPQVMIDRIGNRSVQEGLSQSRLPQFTDTQVEFIKGTSDFFGLNMYTGYMVQYTDDYQANPPTYWGDKGGNTYSDPSWPKSSLDWLTSYPEGLRKLLNYVNDKYKPPEIIVTENGWTDVTGTLDDDDRVSYYQGYLSNLLLALVEDGVNVTGYTLWSLLDNFEWGSGYTQKFGIIHVDFNSPNRTRTWKKSAKWYQNVIATRCLVDQCQ
ncbi:myrosinase 1-like [Cylas formicarius]|uniref:myrosinase 1-like n=1 Tax=Cylas formicarius TaxID=197179 RepID=UPI002958B8A1|nr:myrosinase 1-like [Cylas formicarius]